MKKNYAFYAILFTSLLLNTSLFSAESNKREIAQLKKQNTQIEPITVKKINTLKKVINVLDHTAYCLLTNSKCTPRDRLIINYCLGFAVATTSQMYLFARLLKNRNITDKTWVHMAGQVAGEAALSAAKIKGPLLTPLTTAMQQAIFSAIFLIGDTAQAVEQASKDESVLTFLKEISRSLVQNVQCIWSESYCKVYGRESLMYIMPSSEISPEAMKRGALYFWMGVISGISAKKFVESSLGKKTRIFVGTTVPAKIKQTQLFPSFTLEE